VALVLRPLTLADLDEAAALLDAACGFDAAAKVAEEKLFGPAANDDARHDARHDAHPVAAVQGGRLAGVAVTSGRWLRLLAVHPEQRSAGVGTALLAAAEAAIAGSGAARVHVCDQPGNYLAPGIDVRDRATIEWLERRGYQRRGEHVNLLVDVRPDHDPRVTPERADFLAARSSDYQIRRAGPADAHALDRMIRAEFSAGWAFEVGRALDCAPPAVHIAVAGADIVAFAAHDGNNRGLGWFGPAGTVPAHRGWGLGQALLCACLVDVARMGLATCEIAWIGPREFYQRAARVCGERRFAVLRKDLS
jgi:GNAT superfamily N-acetyltransferase